jgi:hypothetical protein
MKVYDLRCGFFKIIPEFDTVRCIPTLKSGKEIIKEKNKRINCSRRTSADE